MTADDSDALAARMKFIAVQSGARRNYAVPAILERAGMLERFYTDLCGSMGLGAAAASLRRLPGVSGHLQKLHGRRLPAEVLARTRTFGAPVFRRAISGLRSGRRGPDSLSRHTAFSRRWGEAMTRAGFGGATHIFSMLGEGGPFLAEARSRGLAVVSEVYILLSTLRIVSAEQRQFPEWEPPADQRINEQTEQLARDGMIAHSNYFICPSAVVQSDLIAHWGVAAEQTALVPYGMDPKWLELETRPKPGRVLFVGTADLRKGIHYLAQASEQLATADQGYEFRVAGHVTPQIAGRPECRRLNFLGRVPRARIHEEFQQADVFVLPSLAEGSAEVTYEALAAGVPVVTTAASGSVARDGIEGRIVPERDPAALAEAIAGVVTNRDQRDRMAAAARQRARDYTWDRYGERLLAALNAFPRLQTS